MKEEYVDNPEYLKNQYANADNLNVRIRLHEAFSTNKQGLQPWLFDQMAIAPGMQVLELGCGPGNLWLENLGVFQRMWRLSFRIFRTACWGRRRLL